MSFKAQVELVHSFTSRRDEIVAGIAALLNCQKKPLEYQQDFSLLSRQFNDCFFSLASDQAMLRDQLEQAHWNSGFKPRATPGNDLVDPVEQMLRAFHLWRQTHWPGHKGRLHYAHTLFNLYLMRRLALLCMRVWDDVPVVEESATVGDRIRQAQAALDALWNSSPADQPRLVRDVRWLFPVAMSPTTDSLAGYFDVAERITETFTDDDRIATHKAWVLTGAGHLRSQLRDLAMRRDVSLDDKDLVSITRMSNALDVALLMQGLVTMLGAYERCLHSGDERERHALAFVICQGISPDPELFVNRVDLLGPYSMIEQVFITLDDGGEAVYTAAGNRHLALFEQYAALIARLAKPLYKDHQHNELADCTYSPYGLLYGFASNLIELMAFKTLQRDAVTHFSMEDAFTGGATDKLAWVNGWRNLPHIKPEVIQQFQYPRQFAAAISGRIGQALGRRVAGAEATSSAGRLFVVMEGAVSDAGMPAHIPELPLQYIVASEPQLVAAGKAGFRSQGDILHCRLEGEYLVSYETAGGWLGITKDVLTEVLGEGRDAKITGLPVAAGNVLRLMCPHLVICSQHG